MLLYFPRLSTVDLSFATSNNDAAVLSSFLFHLWGVLIQSLTRRV